MTKFIEINGIIVETTGLLVMKLSDIEISFKNGNVGGSLFFENEQKRNKAYEKIHKTVKAKVITT